MLLKTNFMILMREGNGVIIYKMNFFSLDYIEQIIKFYFCGGSDPMCVYNYVQWSSERGLLGGGSERRGESWQLQGEWRNCQIL